MPRRKHDKWIVSTLANFKNEVKGKKTQTGDDVFCPISWGDAAFHHQISKTTLEDLGNALEKALQSKDRDIKQAAKGFWDVVRRAARKDITERITDYVYVRTLWNMPVNLELGPVNVAGDPGMGFDPNTEPVLGNTSEARRITEESHHLQKIEYAYQTKSESDRQALLSHQQVKDLLAFSAKEWEDMTKALKAALESYEERAGGLLVARPFVEQWATDNGRFQRKGLRRFLGPRKGVEMFKEACKTQEDLAQFSNLPPVKNNGTVSINGVSYAVEAEVTYQALCHCCQRHTYKHFDFNDRKVINTFWPLQQGGDFAAIRTLATQVLPTIMTQCIVYIMNGSDENSTPEDWEGTNLEAVNIPVTIHGREQINIYFHVKLEPDVVSGDEDDNEADPNAEVQWKWVVKVETFAPDGNSAEAYTSEELLEIREGL
jgi:hypothetical protein